MAQSERGLYETLVTEAMDAQLAALGGRLQARRSELHEAEAADRIALHVARVIVLAAAGARTAALPQEDYLHRA